MGRKARMKFERRDRGDSPGRSRRRRNVWMVVMVLVLLVVGGSLGTWLWNGARAAPEPAPKFNLFASTGRVVTIDDFLGKQELVLIFYMGAG